MTRSNTQLKSIFLAVVMFVSVLGMGATGIAGAQEGASNITVEVVDAADGDGIEGATVTLTDDSGFEEARETDGGSPATFSGHLLDQDTTYDLTAEKAGYETRTVEAEENDDLTVELAATADASAAYGLGFEAGGTYGLGIPGPTDQTVGDLLQNLEFAGDVYMYDSSASEWNRVTDSATALEPLDGLVVSTDEDFITSFEFAGEPPTNQKNPVTTSLDEGFNFVAAPEENGANAAFSAAPGTEIPRTLNLYDEPTVSPSAEEDFVSSTQQGEGIEGIVGPGPTVNPFAGYFVVSQSEGTLTGTTYSDISLTEANEALGLETGQPIEGTVTASDGTSPIEGAVVSPQGSSLSAVTNESGEYTIEGLPAGDYTVLANADGYINAGFADEIGYDGVTTVHEGVPTSDSEATPTADFSLVEEVSLTLTIEDDQDEALAGEDVSLAGSTPFDDDVSETFETNGDGEIVLDGQPPGTYDLTADAEGFVPSDETIEPAVGDTEASQTFQLKTQPDSLDLSVDEGPYTAGQDTATYRATVKDADGNAIEGVSVDFDISGNDVDPQSAEDTTDSDGIATIDVSTDTAQTVSVTATEQRNAEGERLSGTAAADFVAGAADSLSADVTDDDDGAVANGEDENTYTVTVTDANGNPVQGEQVDVVDSQDVDLLDGVSAEDSAETGENGEATFTATSTNADEFTLAFDSVADATDSDTATSTFVAGDAASIDKVSTDPEDETTGADGESTVTYTVEVTDANDNVIEGVSVASAIDQEATNNPEAAEVSPSSTETDADGQAAFDVTSSEPQEVTVEFTEEQNSNSISETATFEPLEGTANADAIQANPDFTTADPSEHSTTVSVTESSEATQAQLQEIRLDYTAQETDDFTQQNGDLSSISSDQELTTLVFNDGDQDLSDSDAPVVSESGGVVTIDLTDADNVPTLAQDDTIDIALDQIVNPDQAGDYDVDIELEDESGNTDTASTSVAIENDNSIDTASINSPTESEPAIEQSGSTVSVDYNAQDDNFDQATLAVSDGDGTTLYDDSVSEGDGTQEVTLTDSEVSDGDTFNVELTVSDQAGNEESVTQDNAIEVDNSIDTASINSPTNSESAIEQSGSTVSVDYTAEDTNFQDATLVINDGEGTEVASQSVEEGDNTQDLTLSDGDVSDGDTLNVELTVSDQAGNEETVTESNAIEVDDNIDTAASVDDVSPTLVQSSESVTVTYTGNDDNVEDVLLTVMNPSDTNVVSERLIDAGSSLDESVDLSGLSNLEEGTYDVTVEVVDQAGNSDSVTSTDAFEVDDSIDTASINSPTNSEPAIEQSGSTVTVDYNAQDTNFQDATLAINDGQGTQVASESVTEGDNTQELTLTDGDVSDSDTLNVELTVSDQADNEETVTQDNAIEVDDTSPSISSQSLSDDGSGNVDFTFDSDESLDSITVNVEDPDSNQVYTFDEGEFSESSNEQDGFTYTLDTTQAYDDGTGSYTAYVDDAVDAAGNNGGNNGDGDGLSDTHNPEE